MNALVRRRSAVKTLPERITVKQTRRLIIETSKAAKKRKNINQD